MRPGRPRRRLSAVLSVFAVLNAVLAIVYANKRTADPGLALQNHEIWTEAAFFIALYIGAALLSISSRRLFTFAAAIVLFFLGLVVAGDIVNARILTASPLGLVFLVGNLTGASVALAATVVVLLRPAIGDPGSWWDPRDLIWRRGRR